MALGHVQSVGGRAALNAVRPRRGFTSPWQAVCAATSCPALLWYRGRAGGSDTTEQVPPLV